jgi:hypothetical protein
VISQFFQLDRLVVEGGKSVSPQMSPMRDHVLTYCRAKKDMVGFYGRRTQDSIDAKHGELSKWRPRYLINVEYSTRMTPLLSIGMDSFAQSQLVANWSSVSSGLVEEPTNVCEVVFTAWSVSMLGVLNMAVNLHIWLGSSTVVLVSANLPHPSLLAERAFSQYHIQVSDMPVTTNLSQISRVCIVFSTIASATVLS